MKKALTGLLICGLLLAGCAREEAASAPDINDLPPEHGMSVTAPDADFIEIKERLFIAQTNDIYLNPESYFEKTIRYEGMIKAADWSNDKGVNDMHYFVLRYGPGCCGYDGEAGFEIDWEGDMPEVDEWVEVTGYVEFYLYNDFNYLRFHVTEMTVKEERGAEYVTT